MLEKYRQIGTAVGVGIHNDASGLTEINACEVTVDNNQLDFEKKITGIAGVNDLLKHFPVKSLVALNLSGKAVLQKRIEKTEVIQHNNFSLVLPNANIEDFYIQNFISDDYSFVSLIRKTEADKWLASLKSAGFVPLMLSLGPYPVQHIIPQLNFYDNNISFDGYWIQRTQQLAWESVKYNEENKSVFPVKVESETIDEKLVIPYAAAFQLLLSGRLNPILADVNSLTTALGQTTADKKVKFWGGVIMMTIFVLLLINFLILSRLTDANNRLSEQVGISSQSTIDVQKLNDEINQKQVLLKELGWDGGINKSALVDQLASLLPEEVSWNEISVNPVNVALSRVQKTLAFTNRQIIISGNSDKIIPVNEWIERIKTLKWVKNVQLDNYNFNNETNSGQFTVAINY